MALDPFAGLTQPADRPCLDRPSFQETPQVVGQEDGALVPLSRVFLETFQADRIQVEFQFGLKAPGRNRVLVQYLHDRIDGGHPLKGWAAREQQVEDCPQCVNVRGRADRLTRPPGLFGSHEIGRPEQLTRGRLAGLVEPLGQAEVGDFGEIVRQGTSEPFGCGRLISGVPLLIFPGSLFSASRCLGGSCLEQDIRRFEIAVDDPVLVGMVNGPGQRLDKLRSLLRGLRPTVELVGQAGPFHKLEGQEW